MNFTLLETVGLTVSWRWRLDYQRRAIVLDLQLYFIMVSYLLASVLADLRHSRVSVAYKLRRSLAQLLRGCDMRKVCMQLHDKYVSICPRGLNEIHRSAMRGRRL